MVQYESKAISSHINKIPFNLYNLLLLTDCCIYILKECHARIFHAIKYKFITRDIIFMTGELTIIL